MPGVPIGLTTGLLPQRACNYVAALEDVRLGVRLLPCSDRSLPGRSPHQVLEGLHGLVLSGGGDIDPDLQGVPWHPTVYDVIRERDLLERGLLLAALDLEMPILAICRGLQVVNWALGGTLHQDIDAGVPPHGVPKGHCQVDQGIPRHVTSHEIQVVRGTRLAEIVEHRVMGVNSIHHQAIDRLASGLVLSAQARDGVVEAVEHEDAWLVGVQFHPEDLWRTHEPVQRLFAAFAEVARFRAASTSECA